MVQSGCPLWVAGARNKAERIFHGNSAKTETAISVAKMTTTWQHVYLGLELEVDSTLDCQYVYIQVWP